LYCILFTALCLRVVYSYEHERQRPMGTVTTSKGEQFRRWAAVRQRDGNDRCAECESRDTSWVVLNCAQPPLRPTLAMRVEEAV
jgi:hypothetical protein